MNDMSSDDNLSNEDVNHSISLTQDLGRFRIRSRNQRTNPNPDLILDSESCVVESDVESESCRFESDSESELSVRFRF